MAMGASRQVRWRILHATSLGVGALGAQGMSRGRGGTMITRRGFSAAAIFGSLMPARVPEAFAQAGYPAKPIQMIVGFPPGQSSDNAARMVAKHLSDTLKQS